MHRIQRCFLIACTVLSISAFAQEGQPIETDSLDLAAQEPGTRQHYWLRVGSDPADRPVTIPVIVVKGAAQGPVLGLTAALHGNELNGIPVIQRTLEALDPARLRGAVVAVPITNPMGVLTESREYLDGADLNRIFPGNPGGNRSQQLAASLAAGILPHIRYHVDLHTASFGRVNSVYARADLGNDTLARMARSLGADIVLHSEEASAGASRGGTLRGAAAARGIASITLELGDPQVYQEAKIQRGVWGVTNLMKTLGMLQDPPAEPVQHYECARSYWLYTERGGLLEVFPEPGQRVAAGERIALLRNAFGSVIAEYHAPEAGVVIGKSTNPAGINGSRILHLGILARTGER